MKKALLMLSLVAATVSVYAQGYVTFGNRVSWGTSPTANTSRPIYGTDWNGVNGTGATGTKIFGSQYKAQLYYAAGADQTATSLLPAVIAPQTFYTVSSVAGFFPFIDVKFTNSSGGVVVAAGGTATLQVRVWDTTTGSTWETATKRGESLTFNYTHSTSALAGPSDFMMNGFQSFGLTVVPEPATYALGMLGLGIAWIIRRKK